MLLGTDRLGYLLSPPSPPSQHTSTGDASSSLMWIYDAVHERVVEACFLLSHVGLNEQALSQTKTDLSWQRCGLSERARPRSICLMYSRDRCKEMQRWEQSGGEYCVSYWLTLSYLVDLFAELVQNKKKKEGTQCDTCKMSKCTQRVTFVK